jgi:hypothetical protein
VVVGHEDGRVHTGKLTLVDLAGSDTVAMHEVHSLADMIGVQ